MSVEFDFSELTKLAADLDSAPEKLPKYLRKALDVSSRDVKDSARKKVQGRRHFKQAAAALDYELSGYSGAVSGMDSEIGYNLSHRSGPLGHFVEFGSPNAGNQLAPGGELQAALHENEDDFQRGVEAAVDDAMREVNL